MTTYQNFSCPYERAENATVVGNEAHHQFQTGNDVLTSQVPLPSIGGQRNSHYETGSQYVCLIREVVLLKALLTFCHL